MGYNRFTPNVKAMQTIAHFLLLVHMKLGSYLSKGNLIREVI